MGYKFLFVDGFSKLCVGSWLN